MRERVRVAAVSLLLTWVFFFEYLPPGKQVHLWSDIEGYHYPLLNYAHKSLWEGRFPLWDPSIYCGIPFAGNIQAGLFYPPNWLLFIANARLPAHLRNPDNLPAAGTSPHGMRFLSVEILAFLHAWAAFFFGYLWLRERTRWRLPAVLGGAVVGFSGYFLSQMNHLGVVCGYAWIPFALWGVEQASRQREWRPLWKVALGSAFGLLAGYPSTWLVLVVVVAVYALASPWRWRLLPGTAAAGAVSLLFSAVQLLPGWEAARMKSTEFSYGGELPDSAAVYSSFLLPNYANQNRVTEGPDLSETDCLYLGVPALAGILWLLRRGQFPGAMPAVAIAGAILFLVSDPGGIVAATILHVQVVPDVLRRYNLLAGFPLAAALLAASAADDLLGRKPKATARGWMQWAWGAAVLGCSAWLLRLWLPAGHDFAVGLQSAMYPLVLLPLFFAGLVLFRPPSSGLVAAGLLLLVFTELKVFGTNRRFNAITGHADRYWRMDARLGGPALAGLEPSAYHEMLRHPGYRIGLLSGAHPTDMRHYGLATPQGFDPFLPDQYKAAVERFVPFQTNRLFDVDPFREDMLKHFAVRWILVLHDSEMEATLSKHASFRRIESDGTYFQLFEYRFAEPAWRFSGDVAMTSWTPERRAFRVRSDAGGTMVLKEQFYPGWHATVDGKDARVMRAEGTFQSVSVPAGDHAVEFRYAPASLFVGAAISAFTAVLSVAGLFVKMPSRHIMASDSLGSREPTPRMP